MRWTTSEDNPYRGLLKVLVLPPRDLIIPVLPAKFDDRLLFPLCRSCAVAYRKKMTRDADYECKHSVEERAFVTTVTHLELNAALDRGYTVLHVDRVWVWKLWSNTLFQSYVRSFMKIKAEASGWPEDCVDDKSRQEWMREYRERYSIEIDPTHVRENPAKKEISKRFLNSLWGRFAMRNNLARTLLTSSPARFFEIAYDPLCELQTVEMVNQEALFLSYVHKRDFIEENPTCNLFVAIWTTSAARLVLYSYMEKIVQTPGCQLLYTDTGIYYF